MMLLLPVTSLLSVSSSVDLTAGMVMDIGGTDCDAVDGKEEANVEDWAAEEDDETKIEGAEAEVEAGKKFGSPLTP